MNADAAVERVEALLRELGAEGAASFEVLLQSFQRAAVAGVVVNATVLIIGLVLGYVAMRCLRRAIRIDSGDLEGSGVEFGMGVAGTIACGIFGIGCAFAGLANGLMCLQRAIAPRYYFVLKLIEKLG